jgi:hypothetical protein
MKSLFAVLLLLIAVSAVAQEPKGAIQPADPIHIAVRVPVQAVSSNAIDPGAPMIYPPVLPDIGLAEIARKLRAAHAAMQKASKVANDEKPIVAEEPKQESK